MPEQERKGKVRLAQPQGLNASGAATGDEKPSTSGELWAKTSPEKQAILRPIVERLMTHPTSKADPNKLALYLDVAAASYGQPKWLRSLADTMVGEDASLVPLLPPEEREFIMASEGKVSPEDMAATFLETGKRWGPPEKTDQQVLDEFNKGVDNMRVDPPKQKMQKPGTQGTFTINQAENIDTTGKKDVPEEPVKEPDPNFRSVDISDNPDVIAKKKQTTEALTRGLEEVRRKLAEEQKRYPERFK